MRDICSYPQHSVGLNSHWAAGIMGESHPLFSPALYGPWKPHTQLKLNRHSNYWRQETTKKKKRRSLKHLLKHLWRGWGSLLNHRHVPHDIDWPIFFLRITPIAVEKLIQTNWLRFSEFFKLLKKLVLLFLLVDYNAARDQLE